MGNRKPFKTHNTLGNPLCPCCGSNPRNRDKVKCGRCERENRLIQWDRLQDSVREELRRLGLSDGE